jgi:PAS domain S-box-containing protein
MVQFSGKQVSMQHHHDSFGPHHIAHELKLHKESIMEVWKDKICRQIEAANYQTRGEIRNHIPIFLDRLSRLLDSEHPHSASIQDVKEISEVHGEQRANLPEYTLYEMLVEYRLLREAIFEVLEVNGPLDQGTRDIILCSVEQAMTEAAQTFTSFSTQKERDQQEEYQSLLNSIRDYAIIRTDNNGLITDWNTGAELILGYKRNEVLGKNTEFIFTAEDQARGVRKRRMSMATNVGRAEEQRWLVKKDGSRFFGTGVLSPLYDHSHQQVGYVKVIRDVTQLRTIESKLRRKTVEFETIFNAIPDAVIVANKDRIIVNCNPAVRPILGYSPHELVGKPTSIFYSDTQDYEQQGRDKYNPTTTLEGTSSYRARYLTKSGVKVFSETNASILRDENGEVVGYLAIIRDITERIKAEEVFHRLADALPQKIWTSNKDGQIDYYNERFVEYCGLSYPELKEKGWEMFLHPDDVERTRSTWEKAQKTSEVYENELRLRRFDGEYRWHLARAVPVLSDEGKIIKWYGTNTDIHDQRQSYDQLLEERELRERFVSALSHDLRTPLTSAKLSGQVIRRTFKENEKLIKSVDRILSGIDRVDSMIQDLLDANRISAGQQIPIRPSDCNALEVTQSAVEELKLIHGDRFVISQEIENEDYAGHWDCNGLRRMIENLCNNAVKYGSADQPITITLQKFNEKLHILVHNEGNPIPPDDQKSLFLPYRRAKSAESSGKRGWGIGLTLVKGLVDAHHGFISVKSHSFEGTTFDICLPIDFRKP